MILAIGFPQIILILVIIIGLITTIVLINKPKKDNLSDNNRESPEEQQKRHQKEMQEILNQKGVVSKPDDENYTKIEKLNKLKEAGALTDEEFQNEKKKILK